MSEWREISRELLVDSPYLRVAREVVATPTRPDGVDWMVVRRKQAVVVAPRSRSGGFWLIRQERVPIRSLLWEFPAGQIDGVLSSDEILATAHRELAEEAGCVTDAPLIPLGNYWPSAGFTDEYCHLFLATNVESAPTLHRPDDAEMIVEAREFSVSGLWEAVGSGEICDANTLVTLARMVALKHLDR